MHLESHNMHQGSSILANDTISPLNSAGFLKRCSVAKQKLSKMQHSPWKFAGFFTWTCHDYPVTCAWYLKSIWGWRLAICVHIYIYIYIHLYIIRMCLCICLCICICMYVMCIDIRIRYTYTYNWHMYTSQDLVLKLTHSDPMLPSWGPDTGNGAATWVRRRQKHQFPPPKKKSFWWYLFQPIHKSSRPHCHMF